MQPNVTPANWLKNYRWVQTGTIPGGVVWEHPQKPNNEIHLYDDGRIEHYVKDHKIAVIDRKNMQAYLTKLHYY